MRKEVFVLVLALALVLAGCQSGGKTGTTSSSSPFVGGAEGIRVSFLENAPPPEILDASQMSFDIVLKLQNVGEQDIEVNQLKATISGIYPPDFTPAGRTIILQNVQLPKRLEGVRKDSEGEKIEGALDELTFSGLAYTKTLQGNNEFPLEANLCYKYATRAVADFCMRQDLTKTTSGVCQIKGTKAVANSGGPVQVSSAEESVAGRNKVLLKFKIRQSGTGKIFKPDAIGATSAAGCPVGDFTKENFVRVTVNTGVPGTTCSGLTEGQYARLVNGEASFTCIQDNIQYDAIQKATVILDYNHMITASTKILVKHLPFGATAPATSPTAGQTAAQATGTLISGTCTPGQTNPCPSPLASYCSGSQSCVSGAWSTTCADIPNDNCPATLIGGQLSGYCSPTGQTNVCHTQNCLGSQSCMNTFNNPNLGLWTGCVDNPNDGCTPGASGTGSTVNPGASCGTGPGAIRLPPDIRNPLSGNTASPVIPNLDPAFNTVFRIVNCQWQCTTGNAFSAVGGFQCACQDGKTWNQQLLACV